MADKTLTVNGQPFTINRDRKAEVSQLSVNGQAFHIDRTAPVIESDPVGNSRPLLDKLVGGAAAAYSLRDLNSKQGDTNVVNVRRSTDNEEKLFQAKDVSKISDWVVGKQDTNLLATEDEAQAIRISGGSEVSDVFVSSGFTNNKPVYFSTTLSTQLKLVFTSSNPRWLLQNASNSQTFVASTTTGEDEAFPTRIRDFSTYFSGTGTKEITEITPASPAAAAYSLRKVSSSHGEEKVLFSGLDELPWDDANSPIYLENSSGSNGIPFGSNGLNYRRMASTAHLNNSISYKNGILRFESTTTAARNDFNNALRITNLPANKRFTLTGQVRVAINNLTGTSPVGHAPARIDFNDGNQQVVKFENTEFQPFSITQGWNQTLENSSTVYNFFDLQLYGDGANDGTLQGTVAVEFKDLKIIENPNYAVRVRRGDGVEADVKFDYFDKVSLDSPIVNATEDSNTGTQDTDQGFTSTRTLGKFLSESNLSDIGVNSFVGSTKNANDNLYVEEFTPHVNGFTVEAQFAGMGAADTVRCHANIPYQMSEADAAKTKFKVTFTIDEISGQGTGGNQRKLYVKASNNTLNGGGTYFLQNTPNLTSNSDADVSAFTTPGTYTVEGYSYLTGNSMFGGFSFIVYAGTRVKVSNIKYEILHTATVNTWYNQASFVNDAVQQNATKQPTIAEYGALVTNSVGTPTVKFEGSSLSGSSYTSGNSLRADALAATFDGTDNDMFATHVSETNATNRNGVPWGFGLAASSAPRLFFIYHAGGGHGTQIQGTTAGDFEYVGNYSASTSTLFSNNKDFRSANIYKNAFATSENYSVNVGSIALDTFCIGTVQRGSSESLYLDGNVSELILYTSNQSTNRFKIESNINNYYGLYNDANEITQSTWQNDGTEGTFTSTSLDGFTYQNSSSTAFIGVTLSETLALNDSVFVSFNATGVTHPSSSDQSPQIRLRDGIGSGSSGTSAIHQVTNGFNSFTLTYNTGSSGQYIVFSEGDTAGGTVTISDFKVSRIARNGFVETWYDQSGNNKNAVQVNDNKQPQLIANGGLYPNGIKFNGSTTSLSTGSQVLTSNQTGSQSLYAVCNVTDGASGYIAGSAGDDSGGHKRGQSIYYYTTTDEFVLSNGNIATNASVDSISATLGQNVLVSFNCNNNNSNTLHKNSSQTGFSEGYADYDFEPNSDFIIGARGGNVQAGRALNGSILEIITYNSDQSLNRPAIEANINNQYQIY